MPVAAVYVRVSTEDQARHGYSLGAQTEACRARAEALGALQVQIFADEGVSGALLSRPGLTALREAVAVHSVDLVVVWDPDRLSRNLSHQLLLTEEIERARVRLEFVNFEWKNTPEGQLFYALRGAIAQYEKEKIRERTSRGRLQKAKQGRLPAAFRPYGYDYDPHTALLVPNPAEVPVVQRIYRWLLEEGEGPGAIARRLNLLGIPARKGGRWHRTVIRQILANPVYTGIFHANRWDTAGCSLNRHRPEAERVAPSLRPEAEWVPVAVPALVEPADWREAQGRLEQARRLWSGKARAEYLLSGLLTCGRCGMSMSGFVGVDWGVKRRKYTCRRSRAAGGAGGWCGQALAAEPLEQAIWSRLAAALADPDELQAAAGDRADRRDLEQELAAVEVALLQAEKGRANLLALLEQGLLPAGEAVESLGRVKHRVAALTARQRELQTALSTPAAPAIDPGRLASFLTEFRAGRLPMAERKRLVRELVAGIEVDGRRATVFARLPGLFPEKPIDRSPLPH
ncbi:MAG TPA: recombinase family protein [Symbiobacteriaceae bacterium]|nr:recombinase family protein [Symbiobacteriaceae bacterium]